MATLNDEIKNIATSKVNKTLKKAALIKLGLAPYEVKMMLDQYCPVVPRTPRMALFTFGVEIECIVPRNAVRTAAESTGLCYEYQGYNHRDGHDFFKFVTDASVCDNNGDSTNAIECVSPVLSGTSGINRLKTACSTLDQAGARVNRSCGLHVHIGAAGLTQAQYSNVFANYMHLERIIDSFMAPSRANNAYAKTLRHKAAALDAADSILTVRRALNYDRYYKVNCESYDRHKTIEFRQHQGTTNFTKIDNWVKFCGKLVEWSKTHRLDSDITSIDEIKFLTSAEKKYFKERAAAFAAAN